MAGVIEVEGLEHTFGTVKAVQGIGFTVEEGEIFSFLGPNGAGKSTVINVLTTLLPLQTGRAMVAGFDVAADPDRVREAIGIVFQEVTLDRDMTVGETLEFHGRLYGMEKEERRRRIDDLLALVDLTEKRDVLTRHLSGGMKRRLEIARGLLTRPKVLFLDEPTIGLDPRTRRRIWEAIREVNRAGTTIFLTTHYMDEADHLSDRISLVDGGRIVLQGRPVELKNALGQDLIYLETAEKTEAAAVLAAMPAVKEVREKPKGVLLMTAEDGTRLLPDVMAAMARAGIRVTAVNMKKPSMDDVFVHFTGRALVGET
ncbi:ABC-2 type transport system ATP-binding protein [Methanofollis sp. W23]|uniref:ATP-binding cassette domain-containing protein n=1 Tax=Methanofollis sp. W23 TaxID=2817849 RepID=UPI001AE2BA34|nr:ATP-binding cassette domain-containing protein [Methanofollis sp. W23]MBP2146146.1 ABC-2 type transport system ATP-binding protein [Methanofollis sp. W23]